MHFAAVSCVLATLAVSVDLLTLSPVDTTTLLSILSNTSKLEKLTTGTLSMFPEPTTNVSTTPISTTLTATRTWIRRCCDTQQPNQRQRSLIKMSMGLEGIPEGYPEVHVLNVAYNNIDALPAFVFWNNSYANVRKLFLQQNRIQNVSANAFKGMRQMRQVDLSDNLITSLDPFTFKTNARLQKLVLANNLICFDRLQTFLLSHSIEQLILSGNQIDLVYDMTFLGVPNLKSLALNDNKLSSIAPNSFRTLGKLRYLSLANTGVFRLTESMFFNVPVVLNIKETPLASNFEPSLQKVTGESVARLLRLSRLMLDENYFDNPN